jgi:hypothetical protein
VGADGGPPADAQRSDALSPTDAEPSDASLPALRFTQVGCDPPVHLGASVPEGEQVGCGFTVEGPTGRPVELGCLDAHGSPLDCGPGGGWPPMIIQPDTAEPLPVTGWFFMDTTGLAEQQITLWWVATSGSHRAEHQLSFLVEPPAVQIPPQIQVTCDGDGDGFVGVFAGDRLECTVGLSHPDPPPDLGWWVYWPQHLNLVHEPSPRQGAGAGTFAWSWQTDPMEAGRQMMFGFRAGSNVTPPAGMDLTVEVY